MFDQKLSDNESVDAVDFERPFVWDEQQLRWMCHYVYMEILKIYLNFTFFSVVERIVIIILFDLMAY